MRNSLILCLLVAACEGPAGPGGADGTDGADGANGSNGDTGPQGDPGTTPPSPWVVADRVDITVTGLTVDATGANVTFTLKDRDGKPLDRTGMLTPGKVTVSFVLAQLGTFSDGTSAQYTAYTTRSVNAHSAFPPATATQATTEGVEANFQTIDVTKGSYRYTFNASTAAYIATQTQSVLAIAARTVDGVQSFDREMFHVGSMRREEVTGDSCGSCHGTFAMHGGRYTQPEQCILCHTPQTTDPETGNTVDFRVMIHKIHRGEDLPSFVADNTKPYQIVGFGAPPPNGLGYTVHDFSHIAFPGPSTTLSVNISRCDGCHDGAQGTRWKTRPSTDACTSCHDTTVFTATQNPPFTISHEGGVDPTLVNAGTCIVCHGETSGVASVPARHITGVLTTPSLPKLEYKILSVSNTTPGSLPTIRLQVLFDGAPRDIKTSPVNGMTAMIVGPTTDYREYWTTSIQSINSSGVVTTSANLVTVDASQGTFDFTFPATTDPASRPCSQSQLRRDCNIPSDATGTWVAALEGSVTPTGSTRIVAMPPQKEFTINAADPIVPRRKIVEVARCNGCHWDLAFHGGGRKDANYCITCHNPNNANDERMGPRSETSTVFAEAVDFRVMIHKIHMGHELSQPYVLGGNFTFSASNYAGNLEYFDEVRYPRPRNQCSACHMLPAANQRPNWTLPMDRSTKYLPSTTVELTCTERTAATTQDGDDFCQSPFWVINKTNKLPPETSTCTSCHDAPYTAAHALVNTTAGLVESCATCHGPGKEFDVARYHGP